MRSISPTSPNSPNQSKIIKSFVVHNDNMKSTQSNHQCLWHQIKSSSAQINGRYHHSAIIHEGKLYVYGGFDNDVSVLSDFLVRDCMVDIDLDWDGNCNQKNKWKKLGVGGGPGPRHSHSAVCYEGVIYIFGGKIDRFKNTNAVHAYNIKQQTWSTIQPHQQRSKHRIQQATSNKKTPHIQHTDQSAITVVQNCSSQVRPPPIDSHKAILHNKQIIIYGGFCNNQFTNDIYSFNIQSHTWKKLYETNPKKIQKSQQPDPRADFSMAIYKQKLYIYGGKNLSRNFNDFWEFDLMTKKFTKLEINEKIQNRSGHSAIVYKNYMFIFGGITSVTHQRNDLICYCFETKKWIEIWKNCIQKTLSKGKCKKLSHVKLKQTQNNLFKSKLQQQQKIKPKKYRRPLIQQKQQNRKKPQIVKYVHNKKQKQRKKDFLNQIQYQSKQNHQQTKHFSPLIQSLTNSIMLTSNIPPLRNSSRQNLFLKTTQSYVANQSQNYQLKPKKLIARDGHTTDIYQNQMIIFGGDRHMNALNDIVYINLDLMLGTVKLFGKMEEDQKNARVLQKVRQIQLQKIQKEII